MKTFDEAFEIVTKPESDNLLHHNFIQGHDMMQNEKFCNMIDGMARGLWKKLADPRYDGQAAFVETCSTLHGVFVLGQLVGMEMEKEDINIIK